MFLMVSSVYQVCLQVFPTHVSCVASKCFKSRSAHGLATRAGACWREHGRGLQAHVGNRVQFGRPNAGIRLDVWALALPIL
jgi:hypothetical protein